MGATTEYPGTTYIPEVEEAIRRDQERRDVQEGVALWARRKEDLSRQKHREQRELRDMLARYSPWGKPGGGAPCASALRKKNVPFEAHEPPRRFYDLSGEAEPLASMGREGCGAARVRASGGCFELVAVRKEDPALRYTEPLRRCVEERYRYRTSNEQKQRYRKQLDALVAERRAFREEEIARNRELERKVQAQTPPWGKPGPGGLPWRDPKLLGVRFLKSMGWTDKSTTAKVDGRDIDPLALTDMDKFFDDKSTQGINLDPHPGPMPKLDPKNRYKEQVQVYKLTGGVELVPLLTDKRQQFQQQSTRYLATDATRPGYTIESIRALGTGNREYISDLAEQIHRKRGKIMEEQRREQESCRRHFDTWQRLWGRPGHGAPIDHFQRNNLNNILYRPAIY